MSGKSMNDQRIVDYWPSIRLDLISHCTLMELIESVVWWLCDLCLTDFTISEFWYWNKVSFNDAYQFPISFSIPLLLLLKTETIEAVAYYKWRNLTKLYVSFNECSESSAIWICLSFVCRNIVITFWTLIY